MKIDGTSLWRLSAVFWGAALFVLATPSGAEARPLDLFELNSFNTWVQCVEAVAPLPESPTFVQQRERFQALSACGNADRLWEKNGVEPIDRVDLELAVLERQHSLEPSTAPYVCYRRQDQGRRCAEDGDCAQGSSCDAGVCQSAACEDNGDCPSGVCEGGFCQGEVVVPGALCAGTVCQDQDPCSVEQCALDPESELDCRDDGPNGPVCWFASVRPPACLDVVCRVNPPLERTAAACQDLDDDGVPFWLEEVSGTRDDSPDDQNFCGGRVACPLDERCVYDSELGGGQCEPRAECESEGGCPLFELEVKAEDDQQALVWVHFNYSAIPVRVLDLYLTYNRDALVLEDARRLPALSEFGKQLASTHLSDGTLRLSVFDSANSDPIVNGPIIELTFKRVAEVSGAIAFATDAELRQESMAPRQGLPSDPNDPNSLANDDWWGPGRSLTDRSALPTRLALWYSFESLGRPLQYANIMSGLELCERLPECALEPDEVIRARMVAMLDRLQRGEVFASSLLADAGDDPDATERLFGVVANAAYFDGENATMRLPVTVQEPLAPHDQHMTFSTWFYTEGNIENENRDAPQVLFSHNGFDERTRFGLLLRPDPNGDGMDLHFFSGDFLDKDNPPFETPVSSVALRSWHHVAMTLDADTGDVALYFDGELSGETTLGHVPAPIACPQFFNARDVRLHKEGEVLGGSPSESIYMGVARQGLFKIDRMNTQGIGKVEVAGSGQASFRDPDYSAILDKLVYSSNTATGNFEIWIADGDGGNPVQVTEGFGEADFGVKAQRPRWAPDGSAIVFESSVFDVIADDNNARVSHIYYIGYDPVEDRVAVELEGGGVTDTLNYADRIADQTIGFYRLTASEPGRNHTRAQWLEGEDDDQRGVLVMQTSSLRLDDRRIARLVVPENIFSSRVEAIEGLGDDGEELSLLAAHRSVRAAFPDPIEKRRLFYKAGREFIAADDHFEVSASDELGGVVAVSIVYNPPQGAFPARCWDTNRNGVKDGGEDLNEDGLFNEDDCLAFELRNLYVGYDSEGFVPRFLDEEDGVNSEPADGLTTLAGLDKRFQLNLTTRREGSFVRVEVFNRALASQKILPRGSAIATLRFTRAVDNPNASLNGFGAFKVVREQRFLVKDLLSGSDPVEFDPDGHFEDVEDALFSPDGEELLLGAIHVSRPVLLRAPSLSGAADAVRLSEEALRIRGLSWVSQDNFYPCNFLSGYTNPFNKLVVSGLRGGLDETKVYHGLRAAESIRNEAQRGREFLDRQSAELATLVASSCSLGTDCPEFHVCDGGQCIMVDCDPDDPYACLKSNGVACEDDDDCNSEFPICGSLGVCVGSQRLGSCVQRPLTVEQAHCNGRDRCDPSENEDPRAEQFDFVCAAECNTDTQCFTQECLNGPCRFCDNNRCRECRNVGGVVEGCPDRNSFQCVDGACLTECFAFDDGVSQYLCDPATEYCELGRCVLHDWDWPDIAPASFAGLSDMRFDTGPGLVEWDYTVAVGEGFPVEIFAYGVEDFGNAPEVVVEVRGGPVYGDEWNRLGTILVHHKTPSEAQASPYVLEAQYTFDDLRMRLVRSPYRNPTGAATGMGTFDKDFCEQDLRETARLRGDDPNSVDLSRCQHAAPGSKANLGYRVGLPENEGILACQRRGHTGCPQAEETDFTFLKGGFNAVALTNVRIAGSGVFPNRLTRNKVCTYEGTLDPEADEQLRKRFYGPIIEEVSNERDAFCAQNPDLCQEGEGELLNFDVDGRGFALLNCNYVDKLVDANSAGVEFRGLEAGMTPEFPARKGAIVFDNGDTCRIEIDQLRSEPCRDWDRDASIDPLNEATMPVNTLEVSVLRSFAHDDNFTSVARPTRRLSVVAPGLIIDDEDEVPIGQVSVRYTPDAEAQDEYCPLGCEAAEHSLPEDGDLNILYREGRRLKVCAAEGPGCDIALTNLSPGLSCELRGANDERVAFDFVTMDSDRVLVLACQERLPLSGRLVLAEVPQVSGRVGLLLESEDIDGQEVAFRRDVPVDCVNLPCQTGFSFGRPEDRFPGVVLGKPWRFEVVPPAGLECEFVEGEARRQSGVMVRPGALLPDIECRNVPFFKLDVSITNIPAGRTLRVRDEVSGQVRGFRTCGGDADCEGGVGCDRDSGYCRTQGGQSPHFSLNEGASYALSLLSQDSDAPYGDLCAFREGSNTGEMPDRDLRVNGVECEVPGDLPVTVSVLGLLGDNLGLKLTNHDAVNPEAEAVRRTVRRALEPDEVVEFGAFQEGSRLSLVVETPPVAPAQTCAVFAGLEEVQPDSRQTLSPTLAYRVLCTSQEPPEVVTLGGRVNNMIGQDLIVGLFRTDIATRCTTSRDCNDPCDGGDGCVDGFRTTVRCQGEGEDFPGFCGGGNGPTEMARAEVDQNGEYFFDQAVEVGIEYMAKVLRQPRSQFDDQVCRVINPAGMIVNGANNVYVDCIRDEGEVERRFLNVIVSRSPLTNGRVLLDTFVLGANRKFTTEAVLDPSGTRVLTVVDEAGDPLPVDDPTQLRVMVRVAAPGDQGFLQGRGVVFSPLEFELELTDVSVNIAISDEAMVDLVVPQATARLADSGGNDFTQRIDDGDLRCHYTPSSFGEVADGAEVIAATATRACLNDEGGCRPLVAAGNPSSTTTVGATAGLPNQGLWDVTCRLDEAGVNSLSFKGVGNGQGLNASVSLKLPQQQP